MARGGAKERADDPERKCIVSGESGPKAGLIRFVVGPESGDGPPQVVPDILGRWPGRGIYVTAGRAELETATKKSMFSRAARAQVAVPADLADQVERLQAKRVVELVSLARKAGLAICGFEKVKAALDKGRIDKAQVKVLLQASDGSDRGKSKLWTPTGARWFGCLTSDELGLAFGRESVIHAALGAGGLALRVIEDAAKLAGIRESGGATSARKDDTD